VEQYSTQHTNQRVIVVFHHEVKTLNGGMFQLQPSPRPVVFQVGLQVVISHKEATEEQHFVEF
jgi:hypothetical protein